MLDTAEMKQRTQDFILEHVVFLVSIYDHEMRMISVNRKMETGYKHLVLSGDSLSIVFVVKIWSSYYSPLRI